MFQRRHPGTSSKPRHRKSRKLFNRGFILIIVGLVATIVVASGGLLTWKQFVPSARAQSDKSTRQAAPTRSPAAPAQFDQHAPLSDQAINQIIALETEKLNRTPTEQKIDSQLLQALRESRGQKMASGVNLVKVDVGTDTNGKVKVDIAADVTDDLLSRIESLGGHIIYPSFEYHTIRAEVSLGAVETIASYSQVKFIQAAVGSLTSRSRRGVAPALPATVAPAGPGMDLPMNRPGFAERAARVRGQLMNALASSAMPMTPVGSVNSEGDRTHRADDVRNTYGYAGQGIRIGILSDSYNNLGQAPADVANGDLPGAGNPVGNTTPVTVVEDLSAGGTDEGRAMLQIVHDLAPKAQLFFATANLGEASYAANIKALRNPAYHCDIIIDDVFYFDESPFQDGIVAQAVNTVTADGALYFSAAGNEGNLADNTAGYFEGDFNDAGSPAFTFPGGAKTGTIHNFGTVGSPINGDIITAPGNVYNLNWSDPAGASSNDYDLFLVDSGGTVKASSTNLQTGTQNPYEQITPPVLVNGDRLVVFKTAAAAVRGFAINTIRGVLTIGTTGQTHGHATAVNAFGVAATPAAAAGGFSLTGPFPGAFTSANQVETFSSDGPRRVFYNADGTPITPGNVLFGTGGGAVRQKPDITAADGVTTTLPGNSGLNPFYGTSAAAPHAGAIAALLKSANPALTPAQIRTILTTTAVDIHSAGFDVLSGAGIVQAFQAMQAVNPTPTASLLLGAVTQSDAGFSNLNGFAEPGETSNLTVQLTNPSMVNAQAVNTTLSTSTPGVTIRFPDLGLGAIAPGGTAGGLRVFGVSSTVPCATTINWTLTVNFNGPNPTQQIFTFTTIVGKQTGPINATIGSAPPTPSGVTSTSGSQTGRLTRSGNISTCAHPTTNPGLLPSDFGARAYHAYTFTNTNPNPQCVTVTLSSAATNIFSAAYNNSGFVPANPSTNYLADAGFSNPTSTYSFNAPAGQSFTVVVADVGTVVSGTSYTLSVSLATCTDPTPPCTPVTVLTSSLPNGAVGTMYNQQIQSSGGSSQYLYSFSSGTLPNGMQLNQPGGGIFGTPTQAGTFPLNVLVTDLAGCTPGTKALSLTITGNQPGSMAIAGGDSQSALPLQQFATPLAVLVRDGANQPLAGVSVTFTAPSAPATGTFPGNSLTATALTGANGIATAPTLTANPSLGSYQVAASVLGIAGVNFNLTNACPATTVVTSNADSGPGTLRNIIGAGCPGMTVTFDPSVTSITLTSGELSIGQAITINGPGANLLTINGNNAWRIFNIHAGAATVAISGMTLTNGKPSATTNGGGAILINNAAAMGPVNLTGLAIINNDVTLANNMLGGGIDNEGGTVTIDRCTIANNTAAFRGGGIQNQGFGSMTITNSTIANNTAGTGGAGGGIRTLLNLTLTNNTISGNSAGTSGGNISNGGGTTTVGNTIIAGGTLAPSGVGPDISGPFTSNDYNLFQTTAGGTVTGTTTHNITGVSPNLLALANYGGPTTTLLPAPGSPAINAGDPATTGVDQRGLPRPIGAQADIGAVEANYAITATAGTPQSAAINTAFATALQATVKESGNNVANVPVTFTPPGSGASGAFSGSATVNTNTSGIATAPAFTANGTAGGPYNVVASLGGGLGSVNFALTNSKGNQTITVVTHAPANATYNTTFTVAATASSGLPVVYSSAGACTNVGALFTMTSGTGNCAVKYDQPGDANYNAAAQVTESVTAQKAAQTITVNTHAPATATYNTNFTVAATSSSGLVVSYSSSGACTNSGATFTITSGGGTCTVKYDQAGDTNFNAAAQVTESVTAQKANQTITFGPLANKNFGDADFTVSATASSNLAVSFTASGNCTISANSVHLTGAGSCTITAKQGGDTNFNAATDVPQSFAIAKAATTTAVASSFNPSIVTFNVTFTATVSSTAGTPSGTVIFKDGGNPISCTNAGGQTLNASGVATCQTASLTPGSHVITADYSSDTNFAASTGTLSPNETVINRAIVGFSASDYPVNESDGVVHVTVTRTGDLTTAFSVDYATDDTPASRVCSVINGAASSRCDYNTAVGTLKFAANQTQATFDVTINQDSYTETPEKFFMILSNVTNGAAANNGFATVTINDSPPPAGTTNASDDTTAFVRQQYHDFLNRDPDATGLAFWKNNIDKCNDPAQTLPGLTVAQCIEVQRINTSAAFFLSIEFMQTGTFVRSFYVAALNRPNPPSATDATANMPSLAEWLRDTQAVQRNVIVGQGNWQATLDANRLAFMQDFVMRPEFVGLYPTTDTPTQYINKIYLHALLRLPFATELSTGVGLFNGAATAADPTARGQLVLQVTQSPEFISREMSRAFVQMEYFGYLRRNPNDPPDVDFGGYNYWLNKLNQFNGDFIKAEMVKAFITSPEYRRRFGP